MTVLLSGIYLVHHAKLEAVHFHELIATSASRTQTHLSREAENIVTRSFNPETLTGDVEHQKIKDKK